MVKANLYRQDHTKKHTHTHSQKGKKEKKNPKDRTRKEIIKIRSEINEKEMKETIAKINKIGRAHV